MILGPCSKALNPLYRLRWFLAQPLQAKILPNFIRPYFLTYVTFGHIVLLVPLVLLFLLGYDYTFIDPNIDESGVIASYAIVAAFVTSLKANSLICFVTGLSYERVVPIHAAYAVNALVLACFHGYVAYSDGGESEEEEEEDDRRHLSEDSQYSLNGPTPNLWKFLWEAGTNFSGSMLTACVVGLVSLSFFRILRKYFFDVWLVTHILFAFGVIVFGFLHEMKGTVFVVAFWLMDWVIRKGVMAAARYPRSAQIKKVTDDTVVIQFPKGGLDYLPGQFVRISVPSMGPLAHPYTISSSPHEPDITIHVRALGDWSRGVVNLAGTQTSIFVEGPYGGITRDIDNDTRYPNILLVSGGVGVTPHLSLVKHLWNEHHTRNRVLSTLKHVWVVRDNEMLSGFYSDLCPTVEHQEMKELATQGKKSNSTDFENVALLQVQNQVYITRGKSDESSRDSNVEVLQGRPDWKEVLERTIESVQNQNKANEKAHGKLLVCVCGPETMVDQVNQACRSHNMRSMCGAGSYVHVDVHSEVFEY